MIQRPDLPLADQVALVLRPSARLTLGQMVLTQSRFNTGDWGIWVSDPGRDAGTMFKAGDIIIGTANLLQKLSDFQSALIESLEVGGTPTEVYLIRSGVQSTRIPLTYDTIKAAMNVGTSAR